MPDPLPGTYMYHDDHVQGSGLVAPDLRIVMVN